MAFSQLCERAQKELERRLRGERALIALLADLDQFLAPQGNSLMSVSAVSRASDALFLLSLSTSHVLVY